MPLTNNKREYKAKITNTTFIPNLFKNSLLLQEFLFHIYTVGSTNYITILLIGILFAFK